MSEKETASGRGKKFDQTQRLIAIAMREGMTQDAISRECRVAQSVVSGWANGKAQAREHQLRGLIERFGHLLNRPVRDLYLVEDVDVAFNPTHYVDTETGEQHVGDRVPCASRSSRFVEITGPVAWRHTFTRAITVTRGRERALARDPIARWHVHRQQEDRFQLVRLARRSLQGRDFTEWGRELDQWAQGAIQPWYPGNEPNTWVESVDDAARWSATIEAPMSAAELVSLAKDFVAKAHDDLSIHDRLTLVFRLVRALHGLGIYVSEVERA